MTISVTQEDIDKGRPNSCGSCPIALAVRRSTGLLNASVSQSRIISWGGYKPRLDVETPAQAVDFIELFDSNEPVKPFTFELNYDPTN